MSLHFWCCIWLTCYSGICIFKGEDDVDPDGEGGPAWPPKVWPVLLLQVHHGNVIMLAQHCTHMQLQHISFPFPAG